MIIMFQNLKKFYCCKVKLKMNFAPKKYIEKPLPEYVFTKSNIAHKRSPQIWQFQKLIKEYQTVVAIGVNIVNIVFHKPNEPFDISS